MKTLEVNIPGQGLTLEGILYVPEGNGSFPGVVVCHPHSRYGGSMENNVVNSLCEGLAQKSIAALKFNFRGVGNSQGSPGDGQGEKSDVISAVSYLSESELIDKSRIGLVGYSAGSAWGISACCDDARVKVLAAVSPPLPMFDFSCLQNCLKPKYFITGNDDNLIPVDPFLKFCQELPEPRQCVIIDGADHFWSDYAPLLTDNITDFFLKTLYNKR